MKKGKRRFISNQEMPDESTKATTMEEYRNMKWAVTEALMQRKSTIARVSQTSSSSRSSLFRAPSRKEMVGPSDMTEQGANASFTSAQLTEDIQQKPLML